MNFHQILDEFLSGPLSHRKTKCIVDVLIQHAIGYLRWLVWKNSYTLAPLEMTTEDVAYDLVGELVSEIDGPHMHRLRQSILNVLDSQPDISVEAAFKAVCFRTIQLNLPRLFMELNPLRARLLRSLRRFEKANAGVKRIERPTGYWYALSESDTQLEKPPATAEFLWNLPISIGEYRFPAHTVALQLLEKLAAFPEYRQAIHENIVLDITVRILQNDQNAMIETVVEQSEAANIDNESLLCGVQNIINEEKEWVYSQYVQRAKLSKVEADAMIDALIEYVDDLATNINHGHLYYLQKRIPDLTPDRYRQQYRNTYEYIIRSVFTKARRRLQLYSEVNDEAMK